MVQGEGLKVLLQEGAEKGSWPKDFAAKHKFAADPVIPLPDVSQVDLQPDVDEFILIATDGLWDCMPAGEACRFARCVLWDGSRAKRSTAGVGQQSMWCSRRHTLCGTVLTLHYSTHIAMPEYGAVNTGRQQAQRHRN